MMIQDPSWDDDPSSAKLLCHHCGLDSGAPWSHQAILCPKDLEGLGSGLLLLKNLGQSGPNRNTPTCSRCFESKLLISLISCAAISHLLSLRQVELERCSSGRNCGPCFSFDLWAASGGISMCFLIPPYLHNASNLQGDNQTYSMLKHHDDLICFNPTDPTTVGKSLDKNGGPHAEGPLHMRSWRCCSWWWWLPSEPPAASAQFYLILPTVVNSNPAWRFIIGFTTFEWSLLFFMDPEKLCYLSCRHTNISATNVWSHPIILSQFK